METIQFLSTLFTLAHWAAFGILCAVIIFRIVTIYLYRNERKFLGSVGGNIFPKILKPLFAVTMLLIVINVWYYLNIASPIRSFVPDYLNTLVLAAVTMLGVLEILFGFTASGSLMHRNFKKISLAFIIAFTLPVSIYLAMYIPEMFNYPSEDESYILDLPVRGTWSAGHAGGSTLVNYHHALRSQQYAVDITKLNERGEFYRESGLHLFDHYAMGETVYAPVGGIVVRAVDGLPNSEITFSPSEYDNPAGNYIVIEFSDNRFLFLAHLDTGSVQVETGDTITAGHPVGRIGNSGNSSWPHLHMHVQDLPDLDFGNASGYPFRFRSMERNRWFGWRSVSNGFLVRNDRFRSLND